MRSLLAPLALSLLAVGCTDEADTNQTSLQTTPDPAATYRVVVSLESLGTGIDAQAQQDILGYAGRHDIDLSPDLFDWGLEGERNLCFDLFGLNGDAQAIFVADVKELVQSAQLVTVHENVRCDLQ